MTTFDNRDPRDSSYGQDYWLHRCEGFRVEMDGRLIGQVRGLRFRGSIEPELLEVRSGLLGHRLRLIPVERVDEIMPHQKLIGLRAHAASTDTDTPL